MDATDGGTKVRLLVGLVVLLLLVAALYAGIAFKLARSETALLFRPSREPMDAGAAGVAGLRAVQVPTADGLRLECWFLSPPPGRPTILYLHGNGGSLMDRIGRVRRLAEHDYGLLAVEYRGYGGNPGSPSEAGFADDALAALDFLQAHGIASREVVLFGESLGTGVAVRLATRRPVAGVVLDSPYTSIAAVAQRMFPLIPVRLLMRNPFDLVGRIADIDAPLLILQGARDGIIPPDMGETDFQAARLPKTIWTAPEGEHENVLESGGDVELAAFVATCMQAMPPSPAVAGSSSGAP